MNRNIVIRMMKMTATNAIMIAYSNVVESSIGGVDEADGPVEVVGVGVAIDEVPGLGVEDDEPCVGVAD